MTAYVIAIRERVRRPEEYARYKELAATGRGFKGVSAKRLTRPDAFRVLEGADINDVTILQFESFESAVQWYENPDYQAIAAHRFAGADFRMFIVDGNSP